MRDVSLQQVEQLVKVLEFLTPRQRTVFVKTMNKEQMHVFEVACFNLATNHRGLSKKQVAILKKYKRTVEVVASKNYSLSDKRKTTQKGGFVGALLPILGTVLTSFLTK